MENPESTRARFEELKSSILMENAAKKDAKDRKRNIKDRIAVLCAALRANNKRR